MYHSGTLDIRYGGMFASKSRYINGKLTDYANQGLLVAKIVHADDANRNNVLFNDESGSTHHLKYKSLSDEVEIISTNVLQGLDVDRFDVIGIDEAQFFSGLYNFVKDLVENRHKRVLVTGLDGDSNRQKWGEILDLIPLSDSAEKLTATCEHCLFELKQINFKGNVDIIKAPFTKRIVQSNEQKLVGGKNEYVPVCRYHYNL
jgi:thymidine kinase